MDLLFVLDCLGSGGAQRQMVNLAIGLQQRGHKVDFFIYYPQYRHLADRLEKAGIEVFTYAKSNRFSLNVIYALRQRIKSGNYSVILAFLDTPNLYAELARVGARTNSKLVVSERFMYPKGNLPATKWIMQQFHHLADHITVNSHHQRRRMEIEFPWIQGKLSTIYNGIDLQEFFYKNDHMSESKHLEILAVGTIRQKKNPIGIIHAMSIYRQRYGTPFVVRWVGKKAPSKDSQQVFEESVQLLAHFGLTDYWEWLGERSDIPELLNQHHALIHASFYEGLPNAVCEAMACGKPILVSNVCDHPRLVQQGETGFLFDPTSPEEIAQAVHQLATMNVLRRKTMGYRARIFAERELSADVYVRNYELLFHQLLEKTS